VGALRLARSLLLVYTTAPTTTPRREMASQAVEDAWNRAQALATETEGWKEEKKDDVALLTSKNFEGCPVNCFKVVGTTLYLTDESDHFVELPLTLDY
jgi:hypothetical protein